MSTDLSLRWDARFRRQLLEVIQFILVLSLNPDDLTSFLNLMNSSTHYAAIAKLLLTASQFCSTYPSDELVESTKHSIRSMYQLLCHQRSVPTVNDTSTISCLHDSLFTVVFEYLDSTSLWRCSAVNTQWRRVSLKMEYMWKHFLQEEFIRCKELFPMPNEGRLFEELDPKGLI